jgi:circadian clock protein KaiC
MHTNRKREKSSMAKPSPAEPKAKAKTGIPGLDNILCGGFPHNRLYLIEGAPGSGKTTLALQFLLEGVRAGEPGLYITLSETIDELRTVARSHGFDIDGISIFQRSDEAAAEDDEQTLFHTSEVELGEAMKTLLKEVERVKPVRVVFDSLSEIHLLAQTPLRYRKQILSLKRFFAGRRCTVLLLDDETPEQGDRQLQTLAHGVILLEQLSPAYGAERRRLRISKLRGLKYRGGYHDFKIETGGLAVFPRLVASEHREDFEMTPAASGLAELDALLAGGPDWGTTTLIMGPAGGGKSAIATQYALAAIGRGQRAAMFLFDEGVGTLYARSRALGMDVATPVAAGTLSVQQIDPAEMSPGEFAHRVRNAVERDGVRIVVIDSLNGYMSAMPEESFLTAQLHELFSYLRQRGVLTIVIVAQHGFVGPNMEAPVDVSYLADTVLLLRNYEHGGRLHKAISTVKKRSGPHENTIRGFFMEKSGLRVGPPLESFHGILSGHPERTDPGSGMGTAHGPPRE